MNHDSRFADTPTPPYYAVIFTNRLGKNDEGYETMANRMFELAMAHPGCLGAESVRDSDRIGITVSYWMDEDSIAEWKADVRHLAAQKLGIEGWYEHYRLRVARVERDYAGPQGRKI